MELLELVAGICELAVHWRMNLVAFSIVGLCLWVVVSIRSEWMQFLICAPIVIIGAVLIAFAMKHDTNA